MRSVSFSDGELLDRDIIFSDETDLVICFLGCLVKFPAHEGNSWRRRASSNLGNWVCFFLLFFSLPAVLELFTINAHTHTNKEGVTTRGEAERRQRAVSFTRFLDYWLMFDSGRSFSLKYDLIRPPYWLIVPRIVASLTSRSTSIFSPLAFWRLTIL